MTISMTPAYNKYYADMKHRVTGCLRRGGDPLWILLKAAAITRLYCSQLPLHRVNLTQVAFYKEHLPVFEAEAQYYEVRYEAERCRPAASSKNWAAFWLTESTRLQVAIDADPELYDYYQRGRTDHDEKYFGAKPSVAEQYAIRFGAFAALTRYEKELETLFTQLLPA